MMQNIRYFGRLLCSLGWSWRSGRKIALGVVVLLVMSGCAFYAAGGVQSSVNTPDVDALLDRAERTTQLFSNVEQVYEAEIAPIEHVLLGYRDDDPQLVRRIAVSLIREARRTAMEPRLLLAVLLVENPWLETTARSSVGAQGLMQVMPFHRGKWRACAPRLDDIESNICHGAQIFAAYLREEKGNMDRALLRYNGCVKGTNTPNCHQYPTHVYARAGRASLHAWRSLTRRGTMGAAP